MGMRLKTKVIRIKYRLLLLTMDKNMLISYSRCTTLISYQSRKLDVGTQEFSVLFL